MTHFGMKPRAALLSRHVNHARLAATFSARLYRFNLFLPGYGKGCAFEVPGRRTAMRDICSKSG